MNEITLRQAVPFDWPAVSELLAASKLPRDGAQDHLPSFVVALREGTVVGVAGLEIYGDVALLWSVAVRAEQRRQGIGQSLMQELVRQAQAQRMLNIYLLTTTAAGYFATHGFKDTARTAVPPPLLASVAFNGVFQSRQPSCTLDSSRVAAVALPGRSLRMLLARRGSKSRRC